jgi:hypothetical protein
MRRVDIVARAQRAWALLQSMAHSCSVTPPQLGGVCTSWRAHALYCKMQTHSRDQSWRQQQSHETTAAATPVEAALMPMKTANLSLKLHPVSPAPLSGLSPHPSHHPPMKRRSYQISVPHILIFNSGSRMLSHSVLLLLVVTTPMQVCSTRYNV